MPHFRGRRGQTCKVSGSSSLCLCPSLYLCLCLCLSVPVFLIAMINAGVQAADVSRGGIVVPDTFPHHKSLQTVALPFRDAIGQREREGERDRYKKYVYVYVCLYIMFYQLYEDVYDYVYEQLYEHSSCRSISW